jgi:putative spermidine/putrescine transport system ATP-binding protein
VAPGETVVLLGPSGCGKTTLLRILSGLDRPDPGGAVLYDGEDVTQVPIERRRVGMVFQSYALFPNMTVAGNVAYGPRLQGLPRAEAQARAARYLELCRIAPLADRRVDQLSGGQRQRVALARALAAEPRAIFLDEPLTALDASLRETLREEIADLLRGQGVTAVYVTHDQAEAMALADRIVVMSEGRIEQAADPRTIYEAPASRFVATFVGETNAVNGRLYRPEAIRVLPAGEGIAVTVRRATFLGASTRLELETADGGRLVAHDHEARRLASGDRIGMRLDPARALRLED